MRALSFLLLLLPVIDLVLLVRIARRIGGAATLIWLASAFLAGLGLCLTARRVLGAREGTGTAEGRGFPASGRFLRASALLFAGVLLILPGALSDLAAVLILIPPVFRRLVNGLLPPGWSVLFASLERGYRNGSGKDRASSQGFSAPPGGPKIRDAEFEVLGDDGPPDAGQQDFHKDL